MAHFAEIDENNIVVRVLVIDNSEEKRGQEFLAVDLGFGGKWIQTSYNTYGNVHALGGTPLRKNYAGIGHIYDESKDAFIAPKPFDSWILNEDTCLWQAPVAMPTEFASYWDEETLSWKEA